jgi:UDP-N-acetylmuramate dehydrogenase
MQLWQLTTLRVGGPAGELLAPATADELVQVTRDVWASGADWLVLGGGSNVVVSDDGFAGSVIRVLNRGIEVLASDEESVLIRVQAGEPWDALVAHTVERGWAGIEALSGIPGSTGAAPIQNIGAYGQEIASALVAVEFLAWETGELHRVPTSELELGYRTSVLKQGRRGLVLSIDLRLARAANSSIGFPQLASALGVEVGDEIALAEVRRAVLALRASKGMLLDDADPDSVSAGSFFTNPIVSEQFARALPADAPRWLLSPEDAPPVVTPLENYVPERAVPQMAPDEQTEPDTRLVKLSAAWLIERSGVARGFRLPGSRAAVSSKHTLALVNTGGATASEIGELARYLQTRVLAEFGVILQPEPVLVGVEV